MKTFKQLREDTGNPNHANDGKFSSVGGSGSSGSSGSDWKDVPEAKSEHDRAAIKLKDCKVKVRRTGDTMAVYSDTGAFGGTLSKVGSEFQLGGPKKQKFPSMTAALEFLAKKKGFI